MNTKVEYRYYKILCRLHKESTFGRRFKCQLDLASWRFWVITKGYFENILKISHLKILVKSLLFPNTTLGTTENKQGIFNCP